MADDGYEGVTHAGIALVAADTGLILFAQRAYDETDAPDVREKWEFPGGGLNPGEDPQEAAFREFNEEVGSGLYQNEQDDYLKLPDSVTFDLPGGSLEIVGGWRSENGVYQLFIALVPTLIDFAEFRATDEVQNVAWMTPDQAMAAGLRPEMADFPWDILDATDLVSGNDEEDTDMDDYTEVFAEPIPIHGVVAPEEMATGDRRGFEAGSMTKRDGRIVFRWAESDYGEHKGAVAIGSVDRMMRKDNLIHWEGQLMVSAKADEFTALMEFFGGKFGVSVDGDAGSLNMDRSTTEEMAWFDRVRASGLTAVDIPAFAEAYVAFGPHPDMPREDEQIDALAASGDYVSFDRGPGWVTNPKETKRIHDYWTKKGEVGYSKVRWGERGDFTRAKALIGKEIAKHSPATMKYLNQIIAQWHHDALGYWPGDLDKPGNKTTAEARAERKARLSVVPDDAGDIGIVASEDEDSAWEAVLVSSAGGKTVRPPIEYFHKHPDAMGTVIMDPDENGFQRTYGYAAEWGVCHIGYGDRCVEPPRTYSDDYPDFHKGRTKVAGGGFVPTGVLTYNVDHRNAKQILTESATQQHFDNLKNAWAAVRIGEDENGIWFSGVVLPKVPAEDIVKIEASGQVSGEWKYDSLRALLTVNVEGFSIERASAEYDESGNVVALAASAFGQIKDSPCAATPAERLAAIAKIRAEDRAEERLAALRQKRGA